MPLPIRSEEHTSELQSPCNLVCRLLLEKKKKKRQGLAIRASGRLPRTPAAPTRSLRGLSPTPSRLLCLQSRLGGTGTSIFFLRIRRPPRSTLFPNAPPFR